MQGRYWMVAVLTDKRSGSEPGADFDDSKHSGEPAFDWMKAGDGAAAPTEPEQHGPKPDPRGTAPEPHGSAPEQREPHPTGALNVRPPEDEVRRRRDERDAAARSKPVGPRVVQVFMAVLLPFLLLIGAVRAVASPLFLWAEYFRPGFPGDGYGFTPDDRLTYGSYAVDYLANVASPRYLGDLVFPNGDRLFTEGEVSHMADVKLLVLSSYGAGLAILVFFVIAFLGLRRTPRAFARGIFAGALVTLALIAGLAVAAVLAWQQFFTEFHRLFFAAGTWTFRLEDTLIRLFPGQFWMDAAITIGVLVLVASVLLAIFCWPTPKRRARAEAAGAGEPPAAPAHSE
jgi:integral membrane protein (TIGR01906 family)